MAEQGQARRMKLLEMLGGADEAQDLDTIAARLDCDARTVRRDLDVLQRLLQNVQGIEVRRSTVHVSRVGYSPGYFTDQLLRNQQAKHAIAQAVVQALPDDMAIALTAGSTTYSVAQEMRRASVEGSPPHNLIVFTNSVPSLLELVAAGITTGVLGEIYAAEDCAFHTPEFRSAFQPSMAIVGASGVLCTGHGSAGGLDLFSHRAEEAAFLKQLLAGVPEILIAADSSKLGKRHPWSFGGTLLLGKTVRLVTDTLTAEQSDDLAALADRLRRSGTHFDYIAADTLVKETQTETN